MDRAARKVTVARTARVVRKVTVARTGRVVRLDRAVRKDKAILAATVRPGTADRAARSAPTAAAAAHQASAQATELATGQGLAANSPGALTWSFRNLAVNGAARISSRVRMRAHAYTRA